MNKALNFSELPEETKKQLAGVIGVIPGKWEVYAKVWLLLISLNSLADAKWVVNRLRRILDNMGKKGEA